MESIFGNSLALNNIPQIRYLQAPAAFKVAHLKKFLSSKYDLNNLKKSMNIDIIYEGDILLDEFSLMDIAYAYSWERVSVIDTSTLCLFHYRNQFPSPLRLGGSAEAFLPHPQGQQAHQQQVQDDGESSQPSAVREA